MKSKFKKISLILISVVTTLVFLEGLTRIYGTLFVDYDIEMWKYSSHLKVRIEGPQSHQHRAGHRMNLMGVKVQTDDQGNRTCGFSASSSVSKLIFIGDSLTFGWGVEARDTFACLIGRDYLAQNQGGHVQNFAVGNYNADAILEQFLNDVRRERPQILVWGFYVNDIELASRHEEDFTSRHSMFYSWVKSIVYRARWSLNPQSAYVDFYKKEYQNNKKSLLLMARRIQEESQKLGFRFSVVLLPDLNVQGPTEIDGIYDDLKLGLEEHEIQVLNLQKFAEWRTPQSWVSLQDAHPNKSVHFLIYKEFCRQYPEVCGG